MNIRATGTIMNNRLKNICFSEDKKFKQGKREELIRSDDQMVAIKWKDSKCIVNSHRCGTANKGDTLE